MVALLLTGCRAASKDTQLNDVIRQELGDHFSIEWNSSKTFALAWTSKAENVSYLIIQLATQKVILKKENIRATVSWNDDLHVKETTKQGVIKKGNSSTNGIKLINVNDYLVNPK